jgi:neutral ceramidase
VAGHADKPIMFPVGLWSLTFTPGPGSSAQAATLACPLVPHVLPLHLMRIGSVVIGGVPSEFTATAGRRLKDQLRAAFGGSATHVAVSNYANGYAGYVATPEEYGAQHYEGASTLFGPHTLAAYLQTFDMLAEAVQGRIPKPSSSPFVVPAVYRKP